MGNRGCWRLLEAAWEIEAAGGWLLEAGRLEAGGWLGTRGCWRLAAGGWELEAAGGWGAGEAGGLGWLGTIEAAGGCMGTRGWGLGLEAGNAGN